MADPYGDLAPVRPVMSIVLVRKTSPNRHTPSPQRQTANEPAAHVLRHMYILKRLQHAPLPENRSASRGNCPLQENMDQDTRLSFRCACRAFRELVSDQQARARRHFRSCAVRAALSGSCTLFLFVEVVLPLPHLRAAVGRRARQP